MNIIRLIPTNLYGDGRDNYNPESSHVIPGLIRKFVEAKEQNLPYVECWGSGNVSREFLYAPDAAEGIVAATEKYNDIELVNLGCGIEMNISALAIVIAQEIGYKGEIKWNEERPSGQPRRRLNTERAKKYFGWEAKTPFVEGLAKTVSWYLANRQV
jgi:GDP-L-fucose synthase